MSRTADPAVRTALVEAAAEMLAGRETVTARSLAERAGTSTTGLYTHFGGMPGLWRAVRQEGFTRLAHRLAAVPRTADPVADLAALGAAYLAGALADPFLYRAMFDAVADLEDPDAADAAFGVLVESAARAGAAGRLHPDAEPLDVATRFWVAGHGLALLAVTGVLPAGAVGAHGPELAVGVLAAAGDDPARCRASVAEGWPRGGPTGGG